MDEQTIRNRIVEKLLRKRVVGSHNKRADTVVNWLPTHMQGRGRRLLREMLREPAVPVEGYGGSRDTGRLTSVEAAISYLEANGGDVPFGFE